MQHATPFAFRVVDNHSIPVDASHYRADSLIAAALIGHAIQLQGGLKVS